MRATPTYATRARSLLHRAAARLGTADPLGDVGPLIDESLAVPLGAPLPGDALAAGFSEQTPDHLNFVLRAEGPGVTPADRMDLAGHALSRIVGDHFGARRGAGWTAGWSRSRAARRRWRTGARPSAAPTTATA
jgi:hypothetical protein